MRVGSGPNEKANEYGFDYNEAFLPDHFSLDKVVSKQSRKLLVVVTMCSLQPIGLHGSSRDDSKGYFTFP